jgi:lipopolysaccharide transport system ATP-binding protein
VLSKDSTVEVQVKFFAPRGLPLPSVGLTFTGGDGRIVASVGSVNDCITLQQDGEGSGLARVTFPQFPLLKGSYNLDVYLMCEQGLHIYEAVIQATELHVEQKGLALGIVELPHQWN